VVINESDNSSIPRENGRNAFQARAISKS